MCDRAPTALVAIGHPVMRSWTCDVLVSEPGCWTVPQPDAGETLVDAIARVRPGVSTAVSPGEVRVSHDPGFDYDSLSL